MGKYPAEQARVCCDFRHIRELLERSNWTQKHLAERMARIRLPSDKPSRGDPVAAERRSLARLLRGEKVTVRTAERVALALDVGLSEIMAVSPDSSAHPPTILKEIKRCDKAGQYERAITLGCALVDQMRRAIRQGKEEDPLYGKVCVQLAAVYDHHADWDQGVRLLNAYVRSGRAGRQSVDPDRLWAQYQRAVLRRNQLVDMLNRSSWRLPAAEVASRIAECRADLDLVHQLADEGMRISVDHQRGVLAQLQGDFAAALAIFQDALQRRNRLIRVTHADEKRHRLAYEHRRIAQCLAHLGRDPSPDLRTATRIARTEQHDRLLRELKADEPVLLAIYQAKRAAGR